MTTPFVNKQEKEATITRLTEELRQGDDLYDNLHEKHDALKAKIERDRCVSFSRTSDLRIESMTRNLNRQHARLVNLRDKLNALARELEEAKKRGFVQEKPTTVTYEVASTSINYKPSEPVEFNEGFQLAYNQLNDTLKTHIKDEYYYKGFIPKVKVAAHFTIKHKEGHLKKAEPFYRFIHINTVLTSDEIKLEAWLKTLESKINEDSIKGSGFTIDKLISVHVYLYKTTIKYGGSYVEMPSSFKNTRSIINVKNKDHMCFKWSIIAHWVRHAYQKVKNIERVGTLKKYEEECPYDFRGLTYPVNEAGVKVFARNNPQVHITVLDFERPLVRAGPADADDEHVVDLLLYNNHYVLITKLNSFLGDRKDQYVCRHCLQASYRLKENLKDHMGRCTKNQVTDIKMPGEGEDIKFKNYARMVKHPAYLVSDFEAVQDGSSNKREHTPASFMIYMHVDKELNYPGKRVFEYTYDAGVHGKLTNKEYGKEVLHQYYQCLEQISKEYNTFVISRWERYRDPCNMIITDKQQREHADSTSCCYCKSEFSLSNLKVRDHCHLTGKYRGSACQNCNMNIKLDKKLPLYFHNARGYDNHFIWQMLGDERNKTDKLSAINNNREKTMLINFSIPHSVCYSNVLLTGKGKAVNFNCEINVKDSMQMIQGSLDSNIEMIPISDRSHIRNYLKSIGVNHVEIGIDDLTKIGVSTRLTTNILTGIGNKKFINKLFEEAAIDIELKKDMRFDEAIELLCSHTIVPVALIDYLKSEHGRDIVYASNLLTGKGRFPYKWFNTHSKFMSGSLPDIDEWKNDLNNKEVFNDDDLTEAYKVWELTKCKSFKDYHDVYLAIDVYGLCDVIESFRSMTHETYGIDPISYLSLPSYSWDAMLLHTRVELESLKDMDMYMFFEEALYGGLTVSVQKYVKADLEGDGCKTYLKYVDANNQYGYAMCRLLPHSNFKWIDEGALPTKDDILNYKEGEKGMTLEVDLEYPSSLHDAHWDFPLAPYKRGIDETELNALQKEALGGGKHIKTEKLIADFLPRKKYVVHIAYLKDLLEQGLILKKVHSGISYKQSDWLRSYILHNNKLRSVATDKGDEIGRNLFKLMNNSVYGKTMENTRDRMDIKIVDNEEGALVKAQSSTYFKLNSTPIGDKVILDMHKRSTKLDKPIYAGVTILNYSKMVMTDMLYKNMVPYFGRDNVSVVYSDTDSFVLSIKSKDVNADFLEMQKKYDVFDFSKMHKGHTLHKPEGCSINKEVLGKFKDECEGHEIAEFIGLRAKLYSYKMCDGTKGGIKAKGVNTKAISAVYCGGNHLGDVSYFNHDLYQAVYNKRQQVTVDINNIKSSKHVLNTISQKKIALNVFDDKRLMLGNGMTMAYGYKGSKFNSEQ